MHTRTLIVTIAATAIATGCGGGSSNGGDSDEVTAKTRIERCVTAYPDSTVADCEEWESDGELDDDGKHQDHENM